MKKRGSHLVRRLHYVQDGLPAFDCLCASALATEPHPFERQSVDAACYRGPDIRRTTRASLYRSWWRVYRSWCRGCRSWWRGYSWQALLWRGLGRDRTPLLERALVFLRCGGMLAFLPHRVRLGFRVKDRAPFQVRKDFPRRDAICAGAVNVAIRIAMDGPQGGGLQGGLRLCVPCHNHGDAEANQRKQHGQNGNADHAIVVSDP